MTYRLAMIGSTRWRAATALTATALLVTTLAACEDSKKGGGEPVKAAAVLPAEPTAGQWKTWVLTSPAEVAVPAPPAKDSAYYDADLAKVSVEAVTRTPEDESLVRKWSNPVPTQPWTEVAYNFVSRAPKNPPLSSRNYALLHAAMYDAVVASWHYKYVYNTPPPVGVNTVVPAGPDPSYPSEHAAIAGAASRVLAHLYPEQSALRLQEVAEQAANSRVTAGTNTPADVEAGMTLGRGVADKVIARAQTDGADRVWDGQRPPGIGGGPEFWEPPPGSVSPPTAPLAGTWQTWVMGSPSQLRPPPPPAFGTPEFVAAAQEVVEIRNNLTPDQQRIAEFWEGAEGTKLPAGIALDTASADFSEAATNGTNGVKLTVPRSARGLALVAIAMADGGIAAWDAKYAYWNPRPENAIRDLNLDPSWTPYLPTPVFPAYPSGSAGYAGGVEVVMTYLFADKAEIFKRRAEEQAASRLYAGLHWPYDNVSLDGGRQIGALVVERARSDGADQPPPPAS